MRKARFALSINDDAPALLNVMGCSLITPMEVKTARFVALVQKCISDKIDAEILLAVMGLLQGYENLRFLKDRRELYYKNGFLNDTSPDVNSYMQKREDVIIRKLATAIANSKNIPAYLATVPQKISLPAPRYYGKRIAEARESVDILDELKAAHDITHQKLKTISSQTKITPTIADGVTEANKKLDEILERPSKTDRADAYFDALESAELNAFIYSLIGGNITRYSPIEYDQLVKNVKTAMGDMLSMAIMHRLSDEALEEIELNIGIKSPEELTLLVLEKATAQNLDLNTIVFDAMARFAEAYSGYFEETNSQSLDWPDDKSQAFSDEVGQSAIAVTGEVTGEDIGKMTANELHDFLESLFGI